MPPQERTLSANASVEELILANDSSSFIPMRQRQRNDGAAMQGAVNEVDPLSPTKISGDRGGFGQKYVILTSN